MQKDRIDSIDFWRGVALAAILINHIPGNVLGAFTPRNFAFSDSAEIFVFLSGVSVWLAYGRRFATGRAREATAALLRRAGQLYGAHLALSATALLFFGLVTFFSPYDLLMAEEGGGRIEPFLNPAAGLLGLVALTHQLAFFNILPLYVLLIVAAPLLLSLAVRDIRLLLALSAALYAAARAGLVLPAWPGHNGWYFNPFAWQLMFSLGVACAALSRDRGVPYSAPAHGLALGVSIGVAAIVSNCLDLLPGLVDEAGRYLDWDKSELGVARIVDFFALAYAVAFSGVTRWLKGGRVYDFFCRLGRHALTTFCAGSLLSAAGQALRAALDANGLATPLADVLFVAAALFLLDSLTRWIEQARPPQRAPSARPRLAAPAAGKA
ncbi:MAG: OpgC family protein [Methylocystis sp.]|uniref:OpgC family protein n=1 Tax=Methylocystis sp. TaxID=1911079 RepID=UPI003DA415BC